MKKVFLIKKTMDDINFEKEFSKSQRNSKFRKAIEKYNGKISTFGRTFSIEELDYQKLIENETNKSTMSLINSGDIGNNLFDLNIGISLGAKRTGRIICDVAQEMGFSFDGRTEPTKRSKENNSVYQQSGTLINSSGFSEIEFIFKVISKIKEEELFLEKSLKK